MADFGLSTSGLQDATFPLTGNEKSQFDTQLTGGQIPGQVAISTAQIAAKAVAAVPLTFAATIATDASLGYLYTTTLTGNTTLANPSNLQSGGTYFWEVNQDATGARTMAFGNQFKFVGGTKTLTTTASAIDSIACRYDGATLLCTLGAKYS